MITADGWKISVSGVIECDEQVVIVKQGKDLKHRLRGQYHLPTEKVESGEESNLEGAFLRGMKEETGLDVTIKRLLVMKEAKLSRARIAFYLASPVNPNQKPKPAKGADVDEAIYVHKSALEKYFEINVIEEFPDEVKKQLDLEWNY